MKGDDEEGNRRMHFPALPLHTSPLAVGHVNNDPQSAGQPTLDSVLCSPASHTPLPQTPLIVADVTAVTSNGVDDDPALPTFTNAADSSDADGRCSLTVAGLIANDTDNDTDGAAESERSRSTCIATRRDVDTRSDKLTLSTTIELSLTSRAEATNTMKSASN